MNKIFTYFSWKSLGAVAIVLAVGIFLIPRQGDVARSENCDNPPTTPKLNPYQPASYGSVRSLCHDAPTIQFFRPGGYYMSESENSQGISGNNGDEFYVMAWAHNGAAQNLDENQTIARNVTGYFNVNESQVSVSISGTDNNGSPIDTVSGSIPVHLNVGERIEIVDGTATFMDQDGNGISGNLSVSGQSATAYFGDLRACFENAKFIRFKVRIVADASQNPEATISAQEAGQIGGQCLRTGSVTWTTTNVTNPKVYVRDSSSGQEQLVAYADQGTAETPWLVPGNTYTFILRGDNIQEKTAVVNASTLNCGGQTTTPQNPTGSVWFDLNGGVGAQCLRTGVVHWTTSNVTNPKVYVIDPITNEHKLLAYGDQGQAETPWLEPNYTYNFYLKGDNFAQQNATSGVISNSGLQNCGSTVTASATITPTVGGQVSGQCLRNGSVQWTTSNVGNPKLYVINPDNGHEDLVGYATYGNVPINWFKPGLNYTFILRGDNSFEKRQTTGVVDALNCGTTPTPTQLICVATPNPVEVNKPITFTVTGGNGPFNWAIPGGLNFTFSGNTAYGGSYSTSGSKVATVSNATGSANCNVVINPAPNNVCVDNTNATLTYDALTKNGSMYSTVVKWQSGGSHGITITLDSATNAIANGNATGSVQVNNMQAGKTYTFYMKDVTCGTTLASVQITTPAEQVTPVTNGNVTQTNNTTQTSTGTNSPNQSNSSNINGNNNTVTQTNNNCVNNSCNGAATYYVTTTGATVPQNEYRSLAIAKTVRTMNGSFQNSVSVSTTDTVEFQIVVTNTGNQTVNNVRLSDTLPSGMSFVNGSVWSDGGNASDSFLYNGNLYLGNMTSGSTKTVRFQARVNSNNSASLQNIAYVSGDSVSQVQDDAWVFVNPGNVAGGNVNLTYSKKAYNDTKNVDATSVNAVREDYITYTLTVTNTGNAPATNFVITDDLSQVLPYADMVDNGGATVSGNVITYPGITIPAGGSVSKSFKVRVKYYLAGNLSYVMNNTYGNTVTIRINQPQVLGSFIAPKTGADSMALMFGGIVTAAFGLIKKRKFLTNLILAN